MNSEDKIYNLLKKIYVDLQDIQSELKDVRFIYHSLSRACVSKGYKT